MGDVVPIKKPEFICGGCRYLGWVKLEKWCRHPDHPEPYIPRRVCAIIRTGGRCAEFVENDAKNLPGQPTRWPEPVNLEEE